MFLFLLFTNEIKLKDKKKNREKKIIEKLFFEHLFVFGEHKRDNIWFSAAQKLKHKTFSRGFI